MPTPRAPAQRAELVATLRGLTDEQWHAETLCDGWDAGDVAAHLVVREREPIAALGVLGGPLAPLTRRRIQARRSRGRERMLDELAAGPTWWVSAGRLDVSQAVEDWIHHEDVRRGGAGLEPRPTSSRMRGPLWAAAGRFARVNLGRCPAPGVVALVDGERSLRLLVGTGSRFARPTDAAPEVTVSGSAGELALWASGRRGASVDVTGDADLRGAVDTRTRS